ncbi:MAG TPA: antiterminator LoaP [Rectinemataceae bacterium]|nr:antiterminator LoaP [Rectinemataceae bacterium]
MKYYAIHVLTESEDDYVRRLTPLLGGRRIFCPKRVLTIRRRGIQRKETSPVFPGYVFLESEDLLGDLDTYWAARRTPGFIRFLRDNSAPLALSEQDRQLLLHFMSFGEYADTSKVSFDENDRIVVLAGPLKGLEGKIVKVNRRRGRAKVALDICETGFLIDLGFEAVERMTDRGGAANEDN